MIRSIKDKYQKDAIPALTKEFGYSSVMAVPRITKVVVNVGTGRNRDKKDFMETVDKHLALITGQKASPRPARKAIASFKTREGMIIGYKVTLRGARMYDFLDRVINFAIPRTRDFRGLTPTSIDDGGNLTFGIKEHIVFPEMIGEDVKNIFGIEITVVTTAQSKKESLALFRLLGFPLQK